MPAPKGNRFWEMRSSHGRSPKFKKPSELWEGALEYFEWVEDNPLKEDKVFNYQGEIVRTAVNRMRAMTLQGLCVFLDIGTSTLDEYKRKEGFTEVIKRIEEIIYTQKFTGAAADMLNSNIIARDLGLSDKKEVKQEVTDIESLNKLTEFLKENGIDPDAIK